MLRCFLLGALLAARSVLADEVLEPDEPPVLRIDDDPAGAGCLAFSPDGKRLAAGGHYKHKSFLWDVASQEPLAELTKCGDIVFSIAFTGDGKRLVTAGLDSEKSCWRIVLFDGESGKRLQELEPNLGWRAQFSPDSKSLLVATISGRSAIASFALQGGRKSDLILSPRGNAEAFACSPDGKLIATSHEKGIFVWDYKTHRLKHALQPPAIVRSLVFAADSKSLFSGSEDGTVMRWDPSKPRPVWSHKAHADECRTLAIAPDGSFVASGSHDDKVFLWKTETGDKLKDFDNVAGSIESVAVSPNGKTLAVGHSGGIALWPLVAPAQSALPNSSPENPAATPGRRDETKQPPRDAVKFQRHSYLVVTDKATWHVAKTRCEQQGGHLATFETTQEREFLLRLCREAGQPLWLGADDEEEEGQWRWATGKPIAADEIAKWQVDNHQGTQHSLCYWQDFQDFADASSGERLAHVCEWDE